MEIIIVGTKYAGEIKKSAFTVMNYLMPDEGVLPMHSSINVGEAGDACIFFGLSGTGKTTLSADPLRSLIGDDEHGWGDGYTFNFEGGCYAKTIRLSPMYEPDIFATTKRFGTILENVDIDPLTRELDLDSERFTENTRARLPAPLHRQRRPDRASRPAPRQHRVPDRRRVRRAAADLAASPASRPPTTSSAATRPSSPAPRSASRSRRATFSAGFGAPFLPRHPGEYAAMLVDRLERFDVPVWLVNTGWTGGPYGTGERMNIDHTRNMVRAAINGELDGVATVEDPIFRVAVPVSRARRARRGPACRGRPGPTRPPTTRRPASSRRCSTRTSRGTRTASARRSATPARSRSHEDHGDIAVSAPGEG